MDVEFSNKSKFSYNEQNNYLILSFDLMMIGYYSVVDADLKI